MLQDTVTLTFDLLTKKLIGIIYGSWLPMIPRKVHLGEIMFNVNERTDRRTDDMCHL